jgi:hypothetical protein
MKRNVLLKHLKINNCKLQREGSNHSLYINTTNGKMSTIPRHSDINDILVLEICKQLGIPKIKK